MIRFANLDAFLWLWAVPVVVIATVVLGRVSRRRLAKELGTKITPFLSSSVSPARRRLRLALKCLAFTFFVVALARPQVGQSMQEIKVRGVELVIAVDVSTSMLAEDIKPSRLSAAKAELMRLTDLMAGDRVGIVAFAGSAALVSPLTTDVSSLKMFIDSLSTDSVGTQGTNVSAAIDEAKDAFDRGGVENDERARVTKVLLLVSDGEDHEEGALKLARKYASENGLRIFTIAFGTERGGPIPIRDERGFLSGYKRDKNGQNVITSVRGDFLRQLAEAGKGTFHHASAGNLGVQRVKEDLDKLEKMEFASSVATNYDEKFQIPLFIGIVFALLDLLMSERRRAGRIWKGRFEVSEA